MSQPLDYKELLKKYMEAVQRDGVRYVSELQGYSFFTKEELSCLKAIENEVPE